MSLLCRKANKTLSILSRWLNFISIKQRRVLMKSFTESKFGSFSFTGCSMLNGWLVRLTICISVYFEETIKIANLLSCFLKRSTCILSIGEIFQSLAMYVFKVKGNFLNTTSSCYRTLPHVIWEKNSEFLMFCNLFNSEVLETRKISANIARGNVQ